MTASKLFYHSLTPIASAVISLSMLHPSAAIAKSPRANTAKIVNYTTATPATPQPFLLPYGYKDTARATSQVILAGISPSIIDEKDTSFEILALVRPGTTPLQRVSFGQGQGGNPLFNYALKHINTLKNGDQFWKYTFAFEAGSFGKGTLPIKWGNGADQFLIQSADNTTNTSVKTGNPFPLLSFSNAPSQTAFIDTTKDDILSYNKTKRVAPQIVMAGVSPSVVDIVDTSFDVVTILRPGLLPIKEVILKQGGTTLPILNLTKQKILNNGDEIWVASYKFAAGSYGVTTVPIVWGASVGQYSLQVVDVAEQLSNAYPSLRIGAFPAQP